jgi:hypothetical protein
MPMTSQLADKTATSIGGTPISAEAAVTCLGIQDVLRVSAEYTLDVDHLIRLDNSIALPAVPFNIVIDAVTYSAKAAVRGCGAVMSQMYAKKS